MAEVNYHARKWFSSKEINNTQSKMNKQVYLGLSILDISKIAMYEYLHDYIKPKYGHKTKIRRYRQSHS